MTTTRASRAASVPPWGLAMAAMLSVQLGSALSMDLISAVGPAATAWLRLSAGALIFLTLARPRYAHTPPRCAHAARFGGGHRRDGQRYSQRSSASRSAPRSQSSSSAR